MSQLGVLLANLLGGLLSGIAVFFTKKATNTTIAVTALVAAGSALMVVFNTTVAPLASAMFSTSFGQFIGLAFPPISGTCVAAYIAVWVGCATYKLVQRTVTVTAAG